MRQNLLLPMFLVAVALAWASNPERCLAETASRPKIVELEVFPQKLELSAARDSRRVIVTGIGEDGLRYDLSGEAKLTPAGSQVGIDKQRSLARLSKRDSQVRQHRRFSIARFRTGDGHSLQFLA